METGKKKTFKDAHSALPPPPVPQQATLHECAYYHDYTHYIHKCQIFQRLLSKEAAIIC